MIPILFKIVRTAIITTSRGVLAFP